MKNPYIHRKMICVSDSFFGRYQELDRIYSLIESAQQVSVVGDRRIGKSSLLYCLTLPEIQARYTQYDLSQHIFVYIDLLRCSKYTPEEFLRYLLLELRKVTQNQFKLTIPGRNFKVEHFSRTIDKVMDLDKKLVFLLDEFDYVSENERFDLDFFNFLRSIANNSALSFITASTKSLLDLCDKSVISSPFFNIFNTLRLGALARDEALEVIRVPSELAGYSIRDDEEFILELAGTHPLLLQLACNLVFEARTSSSQGSLDQQAIRAVFDQQVHDHFKYAWEALENEEQLRVKKAASADEFSVLPMLSSRPFREFVLRAPISSVPAKKQFGLKMLMTRIRRLNRPAMHIIVGCTILIALVVVGLFIDFIHGIQGLLFIPLAGILTWVVRSVVKARRDSQTPPKQVSILPTDIGKDK
jgi:uncharacterized protein